MTDNQGEKISQNYAKVLRLGYIMSELNLRTARELASAINTSQGYISEILNQKKGVPKTLGQKLEDSLGINRRWFDTGDGDPFTTKNPNPENNPESNAILIGRVPGPDEFTEMTELGNNDFGMVIPKIPFKAWAGYVDNFGDMEYIESLPKYNVTITGATRGRYFAFVVEGDSMENYSTEEFARKSIPSGTIVTGREIQRHHWRNKLHLHRYQNYVIVLPTGIITKEIIEHNTQDGYIICHSLNTKYDDFKIMLDDCVQILNIVRRELPE